MGALLVRRLQQRPAGDHRATANPNAARDLLVATAAQGPVPLVIDTAPPAFPGGPLQIAGTASNATAWLGASFTPVRRRRPTRRSVASCSGLRRWPPDPAAVCAGTASEGRAAAAAGTPVRGLLRRRPAGRRCDRHRHRQGPAAANALVASVTDRLFPGNSTAGYSNGIPGVSLGVGLGSGGGVGGAWARACFSKSREVPAAMSALVRIPGRRIAAEAADQEIDEGPHPGREQAGWRATRACSSIRRAS